MSAEPGGIIRLYTKFRQGLDGLVPAPSSAEVSGGYFLKSDGTWAANGTGDFSGPASSTDKAIVRFNGTGGKTGQNSGITISDVASNIVTLSTTTGNALTIATLDSNKNIVLTPHGTGQLIGTLSDASLTIGVQTGPAVLNTTSGLQYAATGNYSGLSNAVYSNGVANVYPFFHTLSANGTSSAPTNLGASAIEGAFIFAGYANGAFRQNAQILFTTDSAFGNTEYGGELGFYTSSGTGGLAQRVGISKTGSLKVYGQTTAFSSSTGNINIIGADAAGPSIMIDSFGNSSAYNARRANGTLASPTTLTTNQSLCAFQGRGYDGTAYSGARAAISLNTGDVTWTTADHSTRISFSTTPKNSIAISNGVVTIEPSGALSVGRNDHSIAAWGLTGPIFRSETGVTITDTSSVAGTVAVAVSSALATNAYAAANAITITDAATLYLAGGPTNGSNVTITNSYGLWNVGKTRLDGLTTMNNNLTVAGFAIRIDGTANSNGDLGNVGTNFNVRARSQTNTTSSGTVTYNATSSFAVPTLLASSATTYTDAATVYIDGPPIASTNVTITRRHSLYLGGDSTSAASSITGALVISASQGTTATSTGIGNGNINTGGSLVTGGAVTVGTTISSYNGLATAGNGVVTVQGAGRVTAQTGANASVATYTVGASDASFVVSANVLVTASTTHAFTVTVAYTDEGNTARTVTLNFAQLAGTIGTSIANTSGTVPYEGIPIHIRAKAATAITVATTGTFTSVTYNAEGVITKLQ